MPFVGRALTPASPAAAGEGLATPVAAGQVLGTRRLRQEREIVSDVYQFVTASYAIGPSPPLYLRGAFRTPR